MSKVVLRPGESLTIAFEDEHGYACDGIFQVLFDLAGDGKLKILADMAGNVKGDEGVIYEEDFGKVDDGIVACMPEFEPDTKAVLGK